uniref:Chemokine (C-X-C motif) ligand 8b, duplicate 3 n=1 Tax=Cyprinus carpio TaxID=7962 RepID=A0A8C2GS07_CYPCA
MRKFTTSAFVLLTCMMLLSITEGKQSDFLRCQCVKTYSGKPINPKLIQKVQMISAGPQCRNVEIIATLKNGLTCLNPTDEWVKNILEGFINNGPLRESQDCRHQEDRDDI